jgi:hypothetical protein
MTARESALYNVGTTLGTAHGLVQAAKAVHEIAEQVRVWPSGQQNVLWLMQLVGNLEEQKGKRATKLATSVREFANKLQAGQVELAGWLSKGADAISTMALEKKQEYAALLAAIEPDTLQQLRGPHKARARAKTIGQRVMGRIADGLKEIADGEADE